MKIYWLRHGETTENKKATYYGQLDAALTPESRITLEKYESRWPDTITVYSSPLSRAVETAAVIGYANPIVDERLAERNMGIWEGLTYAHIQHQYPEEAVLWQEDWIHYPMPQGESSHNQYCRIKSFIQMLEEKNENALVVSHGGSMQMALAYMVFENIEAFWKFKIVPGGLVTTVCHEGYWYIEEICR